MKQCFSEIKSTFNDVYTYLKNTFEISSNGININDYAHTIKAIRNKKTQEVEYVYIKYAYYNLYSTSPLKFMGVSLKKDLPEEQYKYVSELALSTISTSDWDVIELDLRKDEILHCPCFKALSKLRDVHKNNGVH